jgi:hypothetical protein
MNRQWRDSERQLHEETDWIYVVLWKNESLAAYLTKGAKLYVEGRIQTRSYDDKLLAACNRRRAVSGKLRRSKMDAVFGPDPPTNTRSRLIPPPGTAIAANQRKRLRV